MSEERARLHPDNTFLVEKIVSHFDALTHLGLSLVRHRKNGTDELPRLHVFQRRDSVTGSGIDVLSEAGQWEPPGKLFSALPQIFLSLCRKESAVVKAYHTVSFCQATATTTCCFNNLGYRLEESF